MEFEIAVKKYLELKSQEKEIGDEIKKLRDIIVPVVKEKGGLDYVEDIQVQTNERKTYKYSTELQDLIADIDARKTEEVEQDVATIKSVSDVLTVKKVKVQ